jgi:hypothetical protein
VNMLQAKQHELSSNVNASPLIPNCMSLATRS